MKEVVVVIFYRRQKILNAVAYFASEFFKRRGYYPRQTWIYKMLALLDFGMLRKSGTPCLGLNYYAMEMGPVPQELYNSRHCLGNEKFEFISTDRGWRVEARGEPDLDFFSDDELDEMDSIIDTYVTENADLNGLIDASHEKIRAWRVAWEQAKRLGKGKMFMEFADEFDEGLFSKSEEELTPEESRFLCFYEMTKAEERAEVSV